MVHFGQLLAIYKLDLVIAIPKMGGISTTLAIPLSME